MLTLPQFNCGPHELLMLAMNKDKIRPADITFADSMEEKGKTKAKQRTTYWLLTRGVSDNAPLAESYRSIIFKTLGYHNCLLNNSIKPP